METICLQCGNKGFTNAFVYCVKCLNFAVHRYCLASIPATFDELVHWVCGDDCEGEAQNQSSIRNLNIIPSHTRDLIVVRNDEHVPNNVDLVDYDESAKDRAIIVLHSEDERKICPASSPVQIDDKEKKDKLMQPMRLIIKGIPKKLKKKRRHKMKSSKEKKDVHTFDDDLKSFNEETKQEVRVKDDNSSKQRDRKRVSSNSSKKKKKKKRKTVILSEENFVEDKPEDEQSSEENKCSLSKDNVKNGELEDINKKTIEDIPENLHISTAVPVAMPIWTGGFNIKKKRRHKMKFSKEKKDDHAFDDNLKSFNEETKQEVRGKDDSSSKQRDRKRVSSNSSKKKKKKKRKTVFLSEENLLEDKPEDEKSSEENKCSLSKDNLKNGELEDKNKKTVEDIPENLHISIAVPVAMPIWTGSFDIMNEERVMMNGILAHVSILACAKVYDEALQLRPVLQLQMLPKNDVWPKSFETLEPRGTNIALYFFPSKSSEQDFDCLVDEMIRNELALKATVQNAELLIFNSSELPLLYWKFQSKYYLWGVFRQKQGSPSNSHPCRDEAKDENLIRPNEMDQTSLTKMGRDGLGPHSPLSNSVGNGSDT